MDQGLNSLLKWGVENSEAARDGEHSTEPADATRGINADALKALMGGPSDADLMRESMAAIVSSEVDLENKLVAFDNFEQLVEVIDNANNMQSLGLWTPLIGQLEHKEADMRRMAAWCIGTAVQNNVKAQERLLAMDAIPRLVKLAVDDADQAVRRKSIYALSSEVRNYQPGMDEAVKHLPKDIVGSHNVAAGDMDTIDRIMTTLRERSP